MNVTFIIPTYNEAQNLPELVSSLFALDLPSLNILIVDDNSPDGSGDLAEKLSVQYPGRMDVLHRAGKLGLGSAYLHGFAHAIQAGAQAVGQMDADFSHPIEKVPVLVDSIECCDFVIGSRYVPGGSLDHDWPLWRKGLSAFGNLYARTILGLKIRDVTGGFRLWRKSALEKMPLDRVRSNGYVFQVEMSYLAHLQGLRFTEVPIHFADRRWGQSKMNFRIQVEAAVRVWKLLAIYRNFRANSR